MTVSQKGRPSVLLQAKHVPQVRQVVQGNPGLSLRALAPLVRDACALPSMNDATLQRFLTLHRIERELPAHAQQRAERVYGELTPEHLDLVASLYREMGAWGVLAALERALGFRVSREALLRFLDAHGVPRRPALGAVR